MMDILNRRAFLAGTGVALAGAGASRAALGQPFASDKKKTERSTPIAVSTYSFWRFKEGMKMPMAKCIDEAARMGFDAVDVLLIQMENTEKSYLNKVKRHALINGLDLCCMSTHQGYV